ncbi:N-chimaerin-like isoform X3 [Hydractinia symbiolongicarpus]|uniref:N-chimaerin-like isoform X3 n=2 Tax=Hydractinia symbiolongicarpus TaxID=13093 RepID=UPI00254A26B3|nr:N-chimaerin-like isoform X3 [Hydractinia symbiolongicarpus]
MNYVKIRRYVAGLVLSFSHSVMYRTPKLIQIHNYSNYHKRKMPKSSYTFEVYPTKMEKESTFHMIDEEKHCYEDVQPVWKSYLYQVQLKAPKPQRVVCTQSSVNKPYYYGKECHGPIPREQAEQLVMASEGNYLTRESTRQPGTYALTFRFNNMARNYRLYYDQEEKMHYVGEKRFETIHDLVADGLITLYVDYNAKDYIEHMNLDVQPSNEIPHVDQEDTKKPQETSRSPTRPIQNSFKASECEKAHNFKTHSYYGPHWCHYCRNFMWGLKAQGVRCQDCLYDCHKQCSTLVPLDCSPDKKLVKRVFGVDLTTLIKAHDLRRPAIVDRCISEIEKRGLDIEGLYRVPGFADDITSLQNAIDKDGVVPDISPSAFEDVNVICGLLKSYFRSLPIPVITFDLYDRFVEAVKMEDRLDIIKSLASVLKCLPAAHYETLKYFCRHLQRLTKFQDKNLMNSENLGIVFGPTLMRAPDHMSFEAVGYIPYQKKIVQILIEEQDLLFEK